MPIAAVLARLLLNLDYVTMIFSSCAPLTSKSLAFPTPILSAFDFSFKVLLAWIANQKHIPSTWYVDPEVRSQVLCEVVQAQFICPVGKL